MQNKQNFTLCCGVTLLLCTFAYTPAAAAAKPPISMVIVIDAGHGGEDTGAKGRFSKEKDVVLSISKKVGKLITTHMPDVQLVYTRKTDTLIALEDRGVIANSVNADLFVSIHANANLKKEPYGTETYLMGIDKSEKNMDVARDENSSIIYEENYQKRYEGYDPNSPESFILFSFMQNSYLEQSIALASYVEYEFAHYDKRRSRGIKQAPFLVLWKTTMPSVLIEVGFISNPEEEKYLSSEKGQYEIAESIAEAIFKYKKRLHSKEGLVPEVLEANKRDDDVTVATTQKQPDVPRFAPAPVEDPHPTKPAKSAATTTPKPNNTAATSTSSSKKDADNLLLPHKVNDNKITYHIQIFTVSKPLSKNAPQLKGFKDAACYKYNDTYRYYVGKGTSVKAMAPLLNEMQQKFPGAFVVKLQNNKPYK
ncbi:N-acetylmuramoyl-L-alanine amidase [Bacteroidia bacterium]|nr:N-acetylmuramoyl-L-alanine amidase [Bacteroidia bacterium]